MDREPFAGSAERGNHRQRKEPLAEEGAIFSSHCREREQFDKRREREPFARKGTISRRGSHLQ
jgi:hypothetical protein